MKNLSLLVTLALISLMGTFAPVNANPQGDVLETAEQNYIIDPETGAVIEETDEKAGQRDTEIIKEDALIIKPEEDSASESGQEIIPSDSNIQPDDSTYIDSTTIDDNGNVIIKNTELEAN